MFETNFDGHKKIWRVQKIWGTSPVATLQRDFCLEECTYTKLKSNIYLLPLILLYKLSQFLQNNLLFYSFIKKSVLHELNLYQIAT